jgi:8-oxo-dGTP diphosphatase
MNINEFLERGEDYYLPNLSIDLVIIGLHDEKLKCLLLQLGDKWLLPGGYIGQDESVENAVQRALVERTGLETPHMKFLAVFGDKDRQFGDELKNLSTKFGPSWRDGYWLNNRFVSLTYYSLVNFENSHPVARGFDAYAWFCFDELPEMWMDLKSIALKARNRLREDIKYEHVAFKLLPDQFTMPELHHLHEVILEEKLDRSRFQKKMLSAGIFERLPKRLKESPGRNPYQYSIKTHLF